MRKSQGYTLYELVIAMAILALLATLAIVGYRDFSLRANRTAARTVLLDLQRRQEAYFLQTHAYATTLSTLYGTTTLSDGATEAFVNRDRRFTAALASDSIYRIALSSASATAYTLTATGVNRQASNVSGGDRNCKSLTLSSNGLKTALKDNNDTNLDCWER